MAISKIGFAYVAASGGGSSGNTQSGSVSASITVPTGARAAVVGFNGWASTQLSFGTLAQVTLNGKASTYSLTTIRGTSDSYQTASYLIPLSASDEGTGKTLAWNNNQAVEDGGGVVIRFLAGVDTTGVRDSFEELIDDAVNISTGPMTCQSGDLAIGHATSWGAPAWTSGTDVYSQNLGVTTASFGETDCTGATVTLAEDSNWGGLVALVLKPSSSGVTVTATTGDVAVVGKHVNVALTTAIAATAGSVSIVGKPIDISLGTTINCSPGTVQFEGKQADVVSSLNIALTTGQVQVVGKGISVSLPTSTTIACNTGQVQCTGNPINVQLQTTIPLGLGAVTIEGKPINVSLATIIGTSPGNVDVQGLFATILAATTIPLNVGTVNVVGNRIGVHIDIVYDDFYDFHWETVQDKPMSFLGHTVPNTREGRSKTPSVAPATSRFRSWSRKGRR
jgi:hypothetical protein